MYLKTPRKFYANRGTAITSGVGDMACNVPGFPGKGFKSYAPNMRCDCADRGTGINDRNRENENRGFDGRTH